MRRFAGRDGSIPANLLPGPAVRVNQLLTGDMRKAVHRGLLTGMIWRSVPGSRVKSGHLHAQSRACTHVIEKSKSTYQAFTLL
ncbi:MAG TPA: hypothetical protein VN737_14230 [Bryobacteraceae bacterium]|nr:hypothetical protein [Bryobacteraceae bacterium]